MEYYCFLIYEYGQFFERGNKPFGWRSEPSRNFPYCLKTENKVLFGKSFWNLFSNLKIET